MLEVVAPDPTIQRQLDRMWERNPGRFTLLDRRCEATQLPPVAGLPDQYSSGCGGNTMVEWYYWGEDEEMHKTAACAVCDRVYDYPRFL